MPDTGHPARTVRRGGAYMDYTRMLTTALTALRTRGVTVAPRYAYYEGRHTCTLGSEAWNQTFRKVVAGVKDNQCKLVVNTRAAAIVPSAVEAVTDAPLEQGLAKWATQFLDDEAADIAETVRTAEKSGTQTALLVDYDEDGEVAVFPIDPRAIYVQLSRSGKKLWAVHVWKDEADPYTSATLYLPDRPVIFTSKNAHPLPNPDEFQQREELPNPFGELMLAVVDLGGSVLDDVIPLNDMLNKSLQTQVVVGEAYALPTRIYLGVETYDPITGEVASIIPSINAATGSREVSIPTATDAEGKDRKVIQFDSPEPDKYIAEQESSRVSIARVSHVPAFLLQVGGAQPASGEALEIAYLPHVAWKAAAERNAYGPFLRDVVRLAVRRHLYKLTGKPMGAPQLDVKFSAASTSTAMSRVDQFSAAVTAGMSLGDALVEFLGWDREAADLAESKQREAHAQAFDAGTL